MPDRLRVTVSDADTGEVLDERVVADDYVLICAGRPYLHGTVVHGNGTHILTIKEAGGFNKSKGA